MSFGFLKTEEPDSGQLSMTFKGEELELMMEAFRATDAMTDPIGEKIMLRYLSKKVEIQEEKDQKPKIGFHFNQTEDTQKQ